MADTTPQPQAENAPLAATEPKPEEATHDEDAMEDLESADAPEEAKQDTALEDALDAEEGKKKTFIEKLQDTVRQRKRPKKVSVQRYIPISEIRNDTVILKNGGLRSVLLVDPLNFNLKSETEQEGIIAGYENFVNTLTFPVQIVITSTKVNIEPYILQIRQRAAALEQKPLLRDQALMYAAFIEKLVDVADIMQKRFYVVVPQDDNPPKQSTLSQFLSWMKIDDSAFKVAQRNRAFQQRSILLRDRVNLVESGLHNVGLISRRLKTNELIELYYSLYNPRTSQEQKLKGALNTEELTL
ncbi:hypothetical protein COU80_03010 [Candidatus Peregrinibacteria bacterium CG10_big_fil_rev_8_21_14_0_10_55_24]|nr:MAG: hypothetical protein COU80_03010 [Candidatus Peregrinibacteria bacterium CG10_big_fil_rev_8_21_14_0_10_55_24]